MKIAQLALVLLLVALVLAQDAEKCEACMKPCREKVECKGEPESWCKKRGGDCFNECVQERVEKYGEDCNTCLARCVEFSAGIHRDACLDVCDEEKCDKLDGYDSRVALDQCVEKTCSKASDPDDKNWRDTCTRKCKSDFVLRPRIEASRIVYHKKTDQEVKVQQEAKKESKCKKILKEEKLKISKK